MRVCSHVPLFQVATKVFNIISNDMCELDQMAIYTHPCSASFKQLTKSTSTMKARALEVLKQARSERKGDRRRLDFIILAIRGKKVNFDKASFGKCLPTLRR